MSAFPTVDYASKRIPNPSMPLNEGIKTNTVMFSSDSGREQRRKKGASLRTWELSYIALTDAAYRTIRDFYIANTDVNSFSWTHPISKITFTVRFDTSNFQGENIAHNIKTPIWKLSLKLIQVL